MYIAPSDAFFSMYTFGRKDAEPDRGGADGGGGAVDGGGANDATGPAICGVSEPPPPPQEASSEIKTRLYAKARSRSVLFNATNSTQAPPSNVSC